eukprot:566170-Alexandrium_andersonii.AAC.1
MAAQPPLSTSETLIRRGAPGRKHIDPQRIPRRHRGGRVPRRARPLPRWGPYEYPYVHSKAPTKGGRDTRGRPTTQGRVE